MMFCKELGGVDAVDLGAVGQQHRVGRAWQEVSPGITWGTYWGQSELSQLGTVGWFSSLEDIPGGDASWIGRPVPQLEIRVVIVEGPSPLDHEEAAGAVYGIGVLAGISDLRHLVEGAHEGANRGLHHIAG